MFSNSHDHMVKRSHYCIMIFYNFGVSFYGCIPTFILPYFFHNPTTPILPIYVDQQRPYLEKDTTWTQGMIERKIPGILRTFLTPD